MKNNIHTQLHGIYLVIGHDQAHRHGVEETIVDAVRGGISMIQLREKQIESEIFIELARSIKSYVHGKNIPVIINDRVDIAIKSGADGVHLGQSDLSPEDAREMLGPDAIIGLTVNSLEQLERGNRSAADYLACGSIFPTSSKNNISKLWGIDGLNEAVREASKPLFAIGGIEVSNIGEVARTGVAGVAVISAICNAENVVDTTSNLVSIFSKNRK